MAVPRITIERRFFGRLLPVLAAWLCLGFAAPVLADAPAAPVAFDTPARNVYIMDYDTGAVLYDKLGETRIPTASMSKMMTAYVVFEQLRAHKIALTDTLAVSEDAWRAGGAKSGGSTMFLPLNGSATVEELIRGMLIQSGNDACIVLAEGIAGSQANFVDMMNADVRRFGLTNTHFANATGLPDPDHYSTAHDLAIIASHIIRDFPEYYHYFSELNYTYNGIKQGNRNPLLYKGIGVDGVKTGHTDEAGFCLTASVKRGNRRLIAVITGLGSMGERSDESERIIEWAVNNFQNYALLQAGQPLGTADVWLGQELKVPMVAGQAVTVSMARSARPGMKVVLDYDSPIQAPIHQGQPVGTLTITAPGIDPIVVPVVAGADVAELGRIGRMGAAFSHLFGGH